MECPHCWTNIHSGFHIESFYDRRSETEKFAVYYQICPKCNKYIIYGKLIPKFEDVGSIDVDIDNVNKENLVLIHPRHRAHKPFSSDVPKEYSQGFEEAFSLLQQSPKASAAMSRRLLQKVLEEIAGVRHGTLDSEINEIIKSGNLPSDLASDLDAVRHVGNFAAHPIKDKTTGVIEEVEPGEAGWNLEILEELFDFYFVKPAERKRRRANLNTKLTAAGKPALK